MRSATVNALGAVQALKGLFARMPAESRARWFTVLEEACKVNSRFSSPPQHSIDTAGCQMPPETLRPRSLSTQGGAANAGHVVVQLLLSHGDRSDLRQDGIENLAR